jgi:predicted TPR repeat methyltransferase
MNDCCPPTPINDLNHHFDQERAEEDALDYRDNGINSRGEKMLAYLDMEGVALKSALDIGCGSGALHHELMLRNIVKDVHAMDASEAFLAAAASNANEMGLAERVEYQLGDFALLSEQATEADLVLMDRVVCCYPELEGLLVTAIDKSKQYLVLSYPRDSQLVRLYYRWRALVKSIQRSAFRLYYHEPTRIRELALEGGLELVDQAQEDFWQIDVYRRNS